MRSHFGMALVVTALGAVIPCAGCSSSSSPAAQPEAGTGGCGGAVADVLSAGALCPVDANGNPLAYDEAITSTCATEKLKKGDVEFGQCFEYLVFEVDLDSSGNNYSRCFYDVSSHALVGVLYSTAAGAAQCGGMADPSCTVLNGAGSGFQSCAPVVDAGGTGD